MAKHRNDTTKKEANGDAFLAQLGERVRTIRSRRAMSRKVLAKQSKVSERYLHYRKTFPPKSER